MTPADYELKIQELEELLEEQGQKIIDLEASLVEAEKRNPIIHVAGGIVHLANASIYKIVVMDQGTVNIS